MKMEMMDFTVDVCWAYKDRVIEPCDGFTDKEMAEVGRSPFVPLAQVEKLITELEWAMEIISITFPSDDACYGKAQAFLASVAAWRKGQEGASE